MPIGNVEERRNAFTISSHPQSDETSSGDGLFGKNLVYKRRNSIYYRQVYIVRILSVNRNCRHMFIAHIK